MMFDSLWAGAALSLVFAGLVVAARWSKLRAADLQRARQHRDRFFQVAGQLVADGRTPEPLVHLLRLLGAGMTRKVLPLVMLTQGRGQRTPDVLVRLDDLPEELRKLATEAIFEAVCVITFQDVLLGPVLRRSLCLEEGQAKRNGQNVAPKAEKLAGTVARFELRHAHAT